MVVRGKNSDLKNDLQFTQGGEGHVDGLIR